MSDLNSIISPPAYLCDLLVHAIHDIACLIHHPEHGYTHIPRINANRAETINFQNRHSVENLKLPLRHFFR